MSGRHLRVVECARSWIGTPYRHQASLKGVGTDCLGLLRGVWREVVGDEPVEVPAYSQDWDEPSRRETLWRAARQFLIEKNSNSVAMGDIVLFRMRENAVAKHIGIMARVGPSPSFIHAYSGHTVLESQLTVGWRRRIVAHFAFPEEYIS